MQKINLLLILIILAACKSLPVEKEPVFSLFFESIEAENIHQAVLFYRLKIENPRKTPLISQIRNYSVTINGEKTEAVLQYENLPQIKGGSLHETLLSLHLDMKEAGPENINEDYYKIMLSLDLSNQYGSETPFEEILSAIMEMPNIREPLFSITSIVIMQDELINTKFAVNLHIENLNPFPLSLSAFNYKLYGDGLLWAQGQEKDILTIQGKGTEDAKLVMEMNFAEMRRSLLDQVIAMHQVNYRLNGTAEALIDIPWLTSFNLEFDRAGYSSVIK